MVDEFLPYQYQPRVPGETVPGVPQSGGEAPMGLPFGQGEHTSFVSRALRLDEVSLNMASTRGEKVWFLGYPDDVAPQQMILGWNKDSGYADSILATVQLSITQQDYDGSAARNIFESQLWSIARKAEVRILEPIDVIRSNTALKATVTLLNQTDPHQIAFWQTDDLELWLTIHFQSGIDA